MRTNEKICNFLKLNNFRIVKEEVSSFFGDYYTVFINNNNIKLKISSSRGSEAIDIQTNLPNEDWYDLALVKALLYDEKILDNVTTIEEYSIFLQNNFINIIRLFEDVNYMATRNRLKELANKRVQQMFPGIKY